MPPEKLLDDNMAASLPSSLSSSLSSKLMLLDIF
jgi:hypothetical protein